MRLYSCYTYQWDMPPNVWLPPQTLSGLTGVRLLFPFLFRVRCLFWDCGSQEGRDSATSGNSVVHRGEKSISAIGQFGDSPGTRWRGDSAASVVNSFPPMSLEGFFFFFDHASWWVFLFGNSKTSFFYPLVVITLLNLSFPVTRIMLCVHCALYFCPVP